jgi:hypothetical protein
MNKDLNFSFGIVTNGENYKNIKKIIKSIKVQNIPNFEIIIVGGSFEDAYKNKKIKHIPFDETLKTGWITKKKNLIVDNSKYENIVFLHDYVYLENGWYKGYITFGSDFEIVTNKIKNMDSTRFRDWTLWNADNQFKKNYLLPYWIKGLTSKMYISGTYWIAKKSFMLKFPLNEELIWGEGEDVEWSNRVKLKTSFKFNKHSSVKFLKQKRNDFVKIPYFQLIKLLFKEQFFK